MPGIDDLIPNAMQIRKEAALKEAEKARNMLASPPRPKPRSAR